MTPHRQRVLARRAQERRDTANAEAREQLGLAPTDWARVKATAERRMAQRDAEVEARWAKGSAHAAKINAAVGDE